MRKLLSLITLFILLVPRGVYAQNRPTLPVVIVASCGSATLTSGNPYYMTEDTTGKLCTNATSGAVTVSNTASTPLFTRPSDGTNPIVDAAIGAALSSNPIPVACHNETSPTTIGNTQVGVPECDTSQRLIVVGSVANNGVAAATNRVASTPAIAFSSYANGTAYTSGRDAAATVGTDGLLWSANLPAIRPASYSASKNFAASSTTDNACIPGNATNTVLVTRVRLSGTQTTAGTSNLAVVKRSAADTSGTPANFTVVPDWSGLSAASTTPVSYTGTGPSVGAAVGDVDDQYVTILAAATATGNGVYVGDFSQKPIVLVGTAQALCLNLGGALSGGNISVSFKWMEISNITP